MSFCGQRYKVIIALILQLIGIALEIYGMASTTWEETDDSKQDVHVGLFKRCSHSKITDKTDCSSNVSDNNPDWLKAVQAFAILGGLFQLLSVVFVLVQLRKNESKKYSTLAGILSIIAFICIHVEAMVYAVRSTAKHDGVGLILSDVGGVLSAISAFILKW